MKFQFRVKPWGDVLTPADFTLSLGNLKYKLYVLLLHVSNIKVTAFRSTFVPQRPESAASARQVAVHHSSQPVHTFGSRIFLSSNLTPPASPLLSSSRQWEFSACQVTWDVCCCVIDGDCPSLLRKRERAWQGRGAVGPDPSALEIWVPGKMCTVSILLCLGILPGYNWHFTLKNSVIN